jgi:hypothetical protein
MASQEVATTDAAEVAPISAELAERVRTLMAPIPGDDGAGAEHIVAALLAATTIDDLNAPWEATSGRALAGKRLQVRGISQRESQFEDGQGVFLVVDAVDVKTGEPAMFTTSALAVVIQLAVAYAHGMFPLLAEVVVADKPTKRGFYPYHLKILAASSGRPAAGSDD